ncbi:hypothetical protein DPMN_127307 [Dreissena polymorpha]|uniref:Uncharacterized protein n=1 Tax=Dreissena polymorpha TaxID=45954 RepID=A0A9D4GYZ8_DREPO|nr:hypothetical protein DPMN_127307 [Dreissena polymorpha]
MFKVEKVLAEEAPLQNDCQPCSQSMKGPRDMLPGKCHRDLWEVVHELPDVARLRVFHLP